MRSALWLLAIFAAAVGVALFATRSTGSVTLYWPPYRVDLSLNLVLLLLVGLFVLLHLAIRAFGALMDLPQEAKAWRATQRQQAMHAQLRDALAHLLAGRFSRAKKQALQAHMHAKALQSDASVRSTSLEVQSQSLLIAAEASQSMQESDEREKYVQAALDIALPKSAAHFKEGAILRSARWMLDEHDPRMSLVRLSSLSQGVQRRTLALRLKLRALQLAGEPTQALETARLLAKHGGFSAQASSSMVRSLAISSLSQAHDADQLSRAWDALSPEERAQPAVATHAALRLVNLSANSADEMHWRERSRAWIEPVWLRYPQLLEAEQIRLVSALEASFSGAEAQLDLGWLSKIEIAQRQLPHDVPLQYLAGMACLHRQLWGKAQQLLSQSASHLGDAGLRRSAYRSLSVLAEQRGDADAAMAALKKLV
ncbi:MAG: heme biosynthesis protein HemY [Brachymonas sp.]|nr:heme biosynthesis protein HemY [Brachymonas sp.]